MEYIRYVDSIKEQWNKYLDELTETPFNYSHEKIDFDIEYSTYIFSNESFIVFENNRVIAVAAIYIEEINGDKQISWNNGFCLAPYISNYLTYKEREKISKKISEHIDEIAYDNDVCYIKLRMDPLINGGMNNLFYNFNYLLKYGYVDYSSLTQIVDIRKSMDELFSDIRKGHKSDIKRGKKYEIEIYDLSNVQDEHIELYKRIYELDAGKVTRNSELYRYYLDFIRADKGAIAFAKKNDMYVAVMIVTFYKQTAYYSSYAELTDKLEGIPAGHIMQWNMMNYLKNRGIQFYELGEQVFGKTHYSEPDQKLINISNYKRGFGGYTVPFWRGIKEL